MPDEKLCKDCSQKEVLEETDPDYDWILAGAWICRVTGKPTACMPECPEELDQ